jgi:hypothetical protein
MAFARGKRSLAISDRSGMQFPYIEMVKEWNGSIVHFTEYEPKHPQLDPPYHPADPQGLKRPRADIRPGGGCLVQLDLYYWPGQFDTTATSPNTFSMQPGISGDIINARRSATASVGDVTIITS